jgi:hypothetical protein
MKGSLLAAAFAASLLLAAAPAAHAFHLGQTSDLVPAMNTGCMGAPTCHSSGNVPQVDLTGPTSLAPGATGSYTLTVHNTGSQTYAGLNVTAAEGVFTPGGTDTQLKPNNLTHLNELTHTDKKASSGGQTSFSFDWTAPPAGFTNVTLVGWGNAVDGNVIMTGDAAAMATLTVSSNASQKEEGGVVPADKATGKCEDGVSKNLSALAACIIKCQIKQADSAAKVPPVTFDEEACETSLTATPPSCLAKYNTASGKLVTSTSTSLVCPACLGATQQSTLANSLTNWLDTNNGLIYCNGSTPLP